MEMVGPSLTTTVTVALPCRPRPSLTEAVTTCVPERRLATLMLAPWPIGPSRLDDQSIAGERLPCSKSWAVAAKVIVAPGTKTALLAGALIDTTGAEFTSMATVAWGVL